MVPVVDQCGRLRRRGKDLSRRDTETRDFGDVMARTRDDRRERRDGEKDASTARGFAARARAMVGDWRDGFVRSLEHATERQTVLQWLSLALVVTSALMLWKTLVLATQSESPVVVVLSGSMEPGLRRGICSCSKTDRGGRRSERWWCLTFEDGRCRSCIESFARTMR